MMKLTGLGDPSGIGEGFSFLREGEAKPTKSAGGGGMGQTAQMKKITGTEDDLRKLTMKQMGRILKSYGMAQKQIDTLKRWDRVHVIRDLSTKAASDGIGDGLERFARGEKMKLSEQKQMYRDRINLIWKREIAALSSETSDARGGGDGTGPNQQEVDDAAARAAQKKKEEAAKEDSSDSESDDDDFAADLEEEMMDRTEANQLVAGQTEGDASLGALRNATQDADLSKDARELAALKREREEEKAALSALTPAQRSAAEQGANVNRKIIRKRITKTFPDGRQVTTFKFILNPQEVGTSMARLSKEAEEGKYPKRSHMRPEYAPDPKQVGQSMFEDEDDFEFTVRGNRSHGKRKGGKRGGRATSPNKKGLQFGKLKSKVSKEDRLKKRQREEDEMEVYQSMQKKQGTNNRKERGSVRERRPHVIFSNRLEDIRASAEALHIAKPFHKPVSRKQIPRYYEIISHPMDLGTIRDKIRKYSYHTGDAMLKDFDLMKTNAIKFNGTGTQIAEMAAQVYDYVKKKLEENDAELTHLEEAVADQMGSGKAPKRRKKAAGKKTTKKAASTPSSAAGSMGLDESFLDSMAGEINLDDLDFSSDSE